MTKLSKIMKILAFLGMASLVFISLSCKENVPGDGVVTTSYTITKGTHANGDFDISPTSAAQGDTITLTPFPDSGYEFDEFTFNVTGLTAVSAANGKYTFQMPASNVTVNAVFAEIDTDKEFDVIKGTHANGDFDIDPVKAKLGDTVTLTPNADSGYEFNTFTFSVTGLTAVAGAGGTYTFEMPYSDVTVNALFFDSEGPEVSDIVKGEGIAMYGSFVALDWEPVTGATSYEIWHSGSRLGTATLLEAANIIESEGHYYFISLPVNPEKYENYYSIRALNSSGTEIDPNNRILLSLERKIFGPTVYFYDAKYDNTTAISSEIYTIHETMTFGSVPQGDGRQGEFASRRFAFAFKPGDYTRTNAADQQWRIGFYTTLMGLGRLPTDTTFYNDIRTPAHVQTPEPNNGTCTFWRTAENFQLSATPVGTANIFRWGVSQSAPIRRLQINVTAQMHDGGWVSGGFTADSKFDGSVAYGGQQQWYTRNTNFKSRPGGVGWNYVVQGNTGAADPAESNGSRTNIANTPIIREKPFLFLDTDGEYKVFKPALRYEAVGVSWGSGPNNGMGPGQIIDFLENFYVAKEGVDTAATINAQLEAGKHIYFAPGRFELEAPIHVTKANTILMGHGFSTLYPADSNTYGALFVDDVDGVTLAGLMFDATASNSTYLLSLGDKDANADHSANPTFLFDLCLRVGGYYSVPVHTDVCALINSNNVIGDKLWVWRADHGTGGLIGWTYNTSKNGVVVRGDDVTFYGLFCEHFHEYSTLWIGERGRTYFYQNEAPYDPADQASYSSHGGTVNGWAQYKVANNVDEHYAIGMGLYCVFLDDRILTKPIYITNTIEVPNKPGVEINNACTVYIGTGSAGCGGFSSIINGTGPQAVNQWGGGQLYVTKYVNGTATLGGTTGYYAGVNTVGTTPTDEVHCSYLDGKNLLP